MESRIVRPGRERWKPIPGYEDQYEVSDYGRVRSIRGRRHPRKEPKIMQPWKVNGYDVVGLCRGRERKNTFVHRLVLLAFVGPCPEGQEARHLDGDPRNGRLTNLAYGTHIENLKDREVHGTVNNGSRNGQAVLSEDDVREIRNLALYGMSGVAISRRFAISEQQANRIIRRESWSHV